jgi:uncharacterized peroxidase-related enzyme
MKPASLPAPRLAPLPPAPELADVFAPFVHSLGFIPNSALIMQRRPKLLRAFAQLLGAINGEEGELDHGFRRLLSHVSSRAAGCCYCMAHTAGGALRFGVDEAKLAAIWEYQSSPLYAEAERVALDFALAASAVPNDVTDATFAELRRHWSDGQVVEIVAVISLFGFLNRWNDTMATPLEEEPTQIGEKFLAGRGWEAGKHRR